MIQDPSITIVAHARRWIGTPYHHQASVCGIGCDCLGLVRGVYRDHTGRNPEAPPAYSRDWAEAGRIETMIEAAQRHLTDVPISDARPGHVLLFRLRPDTIAKHAAIMSSDTSMIHAIEGSLACEVSLSPWWRRRLAAVFAFPLVTAVTVTAAGLSPVAIETADTTLIQ